MKPDWDYIRSYLMADNFQQPSTTEETEGHQLQIAYLVEHDILILQGMSVPDGLAKYLVTKNGIELGGLMKDDALWQRARAELINNPKFIGLVTPDLLLQWLRRNKPSKPA